MSLRIACAVIVVAFAVQGCTTTVSYAVLAPHPMVLDDDSCFRKCQLLHAGQTNRYLACLQHCPDVSVVHEKECGEVDYDRAKYNCSTAQNQRFEPFAGIMLILVVVALITVGSLMMI